MTMNMSKKQDFADNQSPFPKILYDVSDFFPGESQKYSAISPCSTMCKLACRGHNLECIRQ